MANHRSFVFNNTDTSQPLVVPSIGRYHLYISPEGQIQVIDHLGNIIEQDINVTFPAETKYYRARIGGFDALNLHMSQMISALLLLGRRIRLEIIL